MIGNITNPQDSNKSKEIIGAGEVKDITKDAKTNDLKGKIIVLMDNFRSDKGEAKVALFNSKDGFPDNPKKAYKAIISKIENEKSEAIFTDIPFGVYAVGVLHDENSNGKMDTGWFGIPIEGFGASNDAKGFMGPPEFDKAKIKLISDSLSIKIKVNY
ncbi:MAG: DUF2141 domain-containing protein [Candidatus Firestonebacteria bacterium]